ncbi:MAG: hypothetical protein M1820_006556 [Bogoriella megaspora]|nr:MAG: hypothetical protein M1820_006556 [Bogoriella megaspora]
MDTVLKPTVAKILSDTDRPIQETAKLCRGNFNDVRDDAASPDVDSIFQTSLQLKRKLDGLERLDESHSGWPLLAAFVNCEYQLFLANIHIPLRNNPWLSHWVEVVRSWQKNSMSESLKHQMANGAPTLQFVRGIRAEFLKMLISPPSGQSIEDLARHSPKSVADSLINSPAKDFNLNNYIRILEEEGIYEPSLISTEPAGASTATNLARVNGIFSENSIDEASIVSQLKDDPSTALHRLRTLPMDIRSMELINSLLFAGLLDEHNPPGLMQDYIQHGLRQIEQRYSDNVTHEIIQEIPVRPEDRDEQARIIKLTVLFMRNLIGRGVITAQAIYYEMQEICVRFIWVKEVRDFRNDLETGIL